MFGYLPPVTRTLIIANIAVFISQLVTGDRLIITFGLWPVGTPPEYEAGLVGFQPWQLVTYSFLHGGFTHLFFNMFAIYMFGADIERLLGPKRFVEYYFASVIMAGIAQLLVSALVTASPYPTVGASGGLFGILLAFAIYFPQRTIVLLIPPIPLPARWFVIIYGAIEMFLGVTGTQAGVAHFAHLGGMLGGFLMIQYWKGRFPFGSRRK